jgi:uncharacterized integral membrane protein
LNTYGIKTILFRRVNAFYPFITGTFFIILVLLLFAVIAIAAALTFLALNSFFHLTIATNDVGSLKALTTGSGFDIDPSRSLAPISLLSAPL